MSLALSWPIPLIANRFAPVYSLWLLWRFSKALCVYQRLSGSALLTRRGARCGGFSCWMCFSWPWRPKSPYRALSLLIGALAFEMRTMIRPRAWRLSPPSYYCLWWFPATLQTAHVHAALAHCSRATKIMAWNAFAAKSAPPLNIKST